MNTVRLVMRSSEERQFLRDMQDNHLSGEALGAAVRSTLTEMFGELAAAAALSFTGDGSDSLEGFAQRVKELFGEGAASIYERVTLATSGAGPALGSPKTEVSPP
jgi:hypothetical protein